MSWNYRVVRNEQELRIFDVYCDDAGAPMATNEVPTCVDGETMDDLRDPLVSMWDALDKPVIEEHEIRRKT